jgi:hypothetical protein
MPPVKLPNLPRTFLVNEIPTDLMAALITTRA